MPSRGRSIRNAVAVGLLSSLVAMVAVLQLRSQAEVVRSLEGQDAASLAFLIDDLHRANDQLATETTSLAAQRDRLSAGGAQALPALQEERQRLRMVEGMDPVRGPGVVLSVDAPLSAIDLQDAVNNLLVGGAEAIAVNDHRVITGTVIRQRGSTVTIDGVAVGGPWTLAAVGDPQRLEEAAGAMTRQLAADSRVRSASYRSEANLEIRATVSPRPLVYGSPS